MASEFATTTTDDQIRQWDDCNYGKPACGRGNDDGPGVLRIDFPGGAGG